MFLSPVYMCLCLHSESSFEFCVKESRAKCNAEKLLLLTVVLNFEYGWLYDRFQMAHRILSKSDRQADTHLQ